MVLFLVIVYVRFDGMLDENNEDIKYYYPTSDLVTEFQILFSSG